MIIEFCVQGLRVSDMNFDEYKKEGFETNLVLELCKKELCMKNLEEFFFFLRTF